VLGWAVVAGCAWTQLLPWVLRQAGWLVRSACTHCWPSQGEESVVGCKMHIHHVQTVSFPCLALFQQDCVSPSLSSFALQDSQTTETPLLLLLLLLLLPLL
jgi:hypothetical protein